MLTKMKPLADKCNSKEWIKTLVDEYPFLWPTDIYGKRFDPYDYDWCEISSLPYAWQVTFIPNFLKEVKELLINKGLLDRYYVIDTKEKYGTFRWIGNLSLDEIDVLEDKYNEILKHHCMWCGDTPSYVSTWGEYVCKDCAQELYSKVKEECNTAKFEDEFISLYFPS